MKFSILFLVAVDLFTLASSATIAQPKKGLDALQLSVAKREAGVTSSAKQGPANPKSLLDFVPQLEGILLPPGEFSTRSLNDTTAIDDIQPALDLLEETEVSLIKTLKDVTEGKGPGALNGLDSLAKLKVNAAWAPMDIVLKDLGSRLPNNLVKLRQWQEKHDAGEPSDSPEIDALADELRRFMGTQSDWEFANDIIKGIHPGSSSGLEVRDVELQRRIAPLVLLGLGFMGGTMFGIGIGSCFARGCLGG